MSVKDKQFRLMLMRFIYVLLLVASAAPAIAESQSSEEAKGEVEYKQGKFSSAAAHFKQALVANPRDAAAHFQLANCLQHMNQSLAAWNEYRYAICLAPNSSIARYARIAMEALPTPPAQTQNLNSKHAQGPGDPVKATVSRITSEARSAQQAIKTEGNDQAAVKTRTGEYLAKQEILRQQQLELEQYNRSAMEQHLATENLKDEDKARLRAESEARVQKERDLAAKEAAASQARAQTDADKLNSTSSGLASQLSVDSKVPGAVKLLPTGTSLYVRQYSKPIPTADAPLPEEEMVADQNKLLLDPHQVPGKRSFKIVPAEAQASAKGLNGGGQSTNSEGASSVGGGQSQGGTRADLRVKAQIVH